MTAHAGAAGRPCDRRLAGRPTWSLPVPWNPVLPGAAPFHLALVADATAKALGLACTGALTATIGGQR